MVERTKKNGEKKNRNTENRRLAFAIFILSQKTRCANKLFKLVTLHYFCATKFAQRLIWIKNKFCVRILPQHFLCVCNVCAFCLHFSLNECAEAFEFEIIEEPVYNVYINSRKKQKAWKKHQKMPYLHSVSADQKKILMYNRLTLLNTSFTHQLSVELSLRSI